MFLLERIDNLEANKLVMKAFEGAIVSSLHVPGWTWNCQEIFWQWTALAGPTLGSWLMQYCMPMFCERIPGGKSARPNFDR